MSEFWANTTQMKGDLVVKHNKLEAAVIRNFGVAIESKDREGIFQHGSLLLAQVNSRKELINFLGILSLFHEQHYGAGSLMPLSGSTKSSYNMHRVKIVTKWIRFLQDVDGINENSVRNNFKNIQTSLTTIERSFPHLARDTKALSKLISGVSGVPAVSPDVRGTPSVSDATADEVIARIKVGVGAVGVGVDGLVAGRWGAWC
jgi:hypothetical protein